MTTSPEPTTLEVLDVELTPLPSPLRLAEPKFLSSLRDVEAQVAALKITDAASNQLAATLQQRITAAGTILTAKHKELKAPVLAQGRAIDEAARGPMARIEAAKLAIKRALTAYDNEQQRIAAEAEQKRQAELRRLEQLRLQEVSAAQAKADELARQLAEAQARNKVMVAPDASFDDEPEPPQKTETQLAIERVQHAPTVVAERPRGVAFRTRLLHRVVDAKQLPAPFQIITANDAAIRATFCNGYKSDDPIPELAGCRFEVEKTPVDTGRSVF